MSKKLKLRNWLSLPDTVAYLSFLFEEKFEAVDVVNLVIEERLPVYWTLQNQSARAVLPFTAMQNFWQIEEKFWDPALKIALDYAREKNLTERCEQLMRPYKFLQFLSPDGTAMESRRAGAYLNGKFEIPFWLCGSIKDYFVSLITGEVGELVSLDGQTVLDEQGRFWNLLQIGLGEGFQEGRNYMPTMAAPTLDQISFKRKDVESLLKVASGTEETSPIPPPPVHPATDRNHKNYAPELHAAIEAWLALYHHGNGIDPTSTNTKVTESWLQSNWPCLGPTARRNRISPVINPRHNKNNGTFTEKQR